MKSYIMYKNQISGVKDVSETIKTVEKIAASSVHSLKRQVSNLNLYVDEIEKTLRTEFMTNLARQQKRDSHEIMADIFNYLDRSAEGKFMEALEEEVPDSAEKIRSLMFTFEDLTKVSSAGIQVIVRTVDKEKLPIALKGATETLRDLFFTNMSERAAKIMKEDMSALGPLRLKDVEEAQQYIVNTAKDLEARGEIVIETGDSEGEMIY